MQELIAVQQSGPKDIGFFGTRNMGFLHQNLIEVLSYAMVLTVCANRTVYSAKVKIECGDTGLKLIGLCRKIMYTPPEQQERMQL